MLPTKLDMAVKLLDWGDAAAAAAILEDCAREAPENELVKFVLGETYARLGRKDDACAAYRAYMALAAEDSLGAAVCLHRLGAEPMPAEMPRAYIRRLFDDYAEGFEKMLLGPLDYHAPSEVAAAVRKLHPEAFSNILDLGCGTGLAAAPFAEEGTAITGVDISGRMLKKAEEKGIYAKLDEADIREWLETCEREFDLVLCADVLVYVGALEAILKKITGVMEAGGLFAFTTEEWEGQGFFLGDDRKYAHARPYVEACMKEAGLDVLWTDATTLRLEHGNPVEGRIYVCSKGAQAAMTP